MQDHVLPVQLAEEIINGLNFRCSATGTLVAYSLGLIPPLVISTTKIQEHRSKILLPFCIASFVFSATFEVIGVEFGVLRLRLN